MYIISDILKFNVKGEIINYNEMAKAQHLHTIGMKDFLLLLLYGSWSLLRGLLKYWCDRNEDEEKIIISIYISFIHSFTLHKSGSSYMLSSILARALQKSIIIIGTEVIYCTATI